MPGDLDVTTDARPEQVLELLRGWAGSTWNTGIAFGTVGAEVRGVRLEITTFRADRYDRESRNPEVAWGDSLVDDLAAPGLHRQRHGGLAGPRPDRHRSVRRPR